MNITIPDDFEIPKDSQVVIVIQGTPEAIRERLKDILLDTIEHKPIQCLTIHSGSKTYISTPVWGGKKY